MDSHSHTETSIGYVCLFFLEDKEKNHVLPLEIPAPPGSCA